MSDYPKLSELGSHIKTALEDLPEGSRLSADYIDGLEGLGYTGSRGSAGYIGSRGARGFTGSVGGAGFTGSRGARGFNGSQGFAGSRGATGFTGSKGTAGTNGFNGSVGPRGFTGSRGVGFAGSRGTAGAPGGVGYTGSRGIGFTGSRGAAGYHGSRGDAGFTGSRGARGFNGSRGFTGSKGVAGATGFVGSRGARGFTGSVGPRGFGGSRGVLGFTGSRGLIGLTGSRGATGFVGSTGARGFNGSVGPRGYGGSKGAAGSTGFTGSRGVGFTGSRGARGFNGSVGPRGFLGSRGPMGWTGSRGVIGWAGSKGTAGTNGFNGSRGWVGSRGLIGLTGSRGFAGSKGEVGYVGSQGLQGDAGNFGFTGSHGYHGSKGFTGSRGTSGYVGSQGTLGYAGSRGFVGSAGAGFTGSRGALGFVGSQGSIGWTGSTGAGYVGSRGIPGELGFTGSRGAGWTGSQGITGFTGSVGELGYTGSVGPIGFTGSIGELGYTGSQGDRGPIGYPGIQPFYLGEIETWEDLPSANNSLGDMYLLDGNQIVWVEGDSGEQWLELPYRGPQGYVGSVGPQGIPSIIPNFIGTVPTTDDLPDPATESDEDDAYTVGGNLYVNKANAWVDLGSWVGPVGEAGVTGFTGSQGAVGIRLNIKGALVDIGDLPESPSDDDAWLVGPELYFWEETANGWIGVGQIVGYSGSVGYTGSRGMSVLANAAYGANGSIQFNNDGVLSGSANLTISGTDLDTIFGSNASITLAANTFTVSANNQHRLSISGLDDGGQNHSVFTIGANSAYSTIYANGILSFESNNYVRFNRGVIAANTGVQTLFHYPGSGTWLMNVDSANSVVSIGTDTGLRFYPNRTGSANNDLSKHLALYSTYYGFNVTAGRLGIVTATNANVSITTSDNTTHFTFDTTNDQALFPIGTAAAPSITFNGDPDVGMYRKGTNSLGFSTAGAEGFYLDASGHPFFPLHATIASAGNAYMGTGGQLQRSTSSLRYKKDVEDAEYWRSLNLVENSRPVWYRSKNTADDPDWSWFGFIAEELALVDPRFVLWDYLKEDLDENGAPIEGAEKVPDGVAYDRMVAPIIQVLQHALQEIETLKAKVAALESANTS